ncbi:MAG: hypothetical protein KF902_14515 [Phycisphaeraceae bacterium]|nr:hypothetical protein [Phycisphaeraceae bacterium]
MSKARLEADRAEYDDHMRLARDAENRHDYAEALRHAMAALEHVDAMMKFERRYEETEFDSVPCIDMVVRLAPLIFHAESIERVRAILKQHRAVERNTSADLAKTLDDAVARMADARRLWNSIEANPGTTLNALQESLGGDPGVWRDIVSQWVSASIVCRAIIPRGVELRLASEITAPARARCSRCTRLVQGKRGQFYTEQRCPTCGLDAMFVMVPDAETNDTGVPE